VTAAEHLFSSRLPALLGNAETISIFPELLFLSMSTLALTDYVLTPIGKITLLPYPCHFLISRLFSLVVYSLRCSDLTAFELAG